jgi:limonene-1,2-epoxide hydrolase
MSSELEQENERIVTQFCKDWENRDAVALAEYLSEDVVYQMFEGNPDIIGKDQFISTLEKFLKSMKEVDWEITRSYAVGELVINERIDHFVGEDESKSMHFGIAGFFLVRDGKIKLWRDYSMPGGINQVGGSFSGG